MRTILFRCGVCGESFQDECVLSIHSCASEPTRTTEARGERHNENKLRWRNFPMFLMEPLVEVGAAAEKHPGRPEGKYDTFNFLKGMGVNDSLDCAKRHLMKAESPHHDDIDEESKVHHLAHAAWNLLVALHNIRTRPDLDDRYKTQIKKDKK